MHTSRPRTPRRLPALLLAAAATTAFSAASTPGLAQAATPDFPTYSLSASHTLPSSERGDIAGSAFVGRDGQFHWISSYATYASTDTGSDTITFTNNDFGALTADSGTTSVTDDTWYGRSGSLCYQVDKAASNPAPSAYEDDHCDVVGIWVDPATGTWYGVVNDEYDFNPWGSSSQTVTQRVGTGIHGNRILTASSTDQGAHWTYGGEIITSPYTDHDVFDATATPGKTWDYGVAGCRLFVDHATGYFYVVYNTQIKLKPGYTSVYSWPAVARAPISGKMAPGTWNKYHDGQWLEPGIAGHDGNVGNALGLVANYNPAADQVDFTGTGANGAAVDYRSVWLSNNQFTFNDASGASYTANASTGVITDSTGASVASVSYQDPALNSSVTVAGANSKISVTITDATGATATATVANGVLEDTATHRLYLSPNVIQESAFTYNAYTGGYFSVGYDKYAYQTFDLGRPNSLSIVGAEPSTASSSYLTSIDYGSLTNQGLSTRSYRMVSALNGGEWDVTMVPHSSGQTHFAARKTPVDSTGTAISSASAYSLSLGGATLADGSGTQWKLVDVTDSFNSGYVSGVYKIQNTATGQYLQVAGSTSTAKRAVGAAITTGAAQPNYSSTGNGGNGAPGGSDQWYLQPVGNDTPATLSSGSSSATIAAASNTSLASVTTYKVVNRNSGLALELVNGSWQLAGQNFADTGQVVTITKVA